MYRLPASSTRSWTNNCLCNKQKPTLNLWNPSLRYSSHIKNISNVKISHINLSIDSQYKGLYSERTDMRYMSTSGKPPNLTDDPRTMHKTNMQQSEDSTGKRARFDKLFSLVRDKGPQLQSFAYNKSITQNSAAMTLSSKTVKKEVEDWNDILNRWYERYQDFVGITDLKHAQDKVTELSETLLETQSRRRELQAQIEKLQENLITNQQKITKTELYSDEHYTLFDEAREMNASLKSMRGEFEYCERTERDTFSQLSAAIRDCHERERFQAEQSKYWSIIASVVSAALASIITSVNNWVRIREVKDHVTNNTKELMESYIQMHNDVVSSISDALAVSDVSLSKDNTGESITGETASVTSHKRASQVKLGVHEVPQTENLNGVSVSELNVLKDSVNSNKKDMALLVKAVGSMKEDMSSMNNSTEQTLKEHIASLLSEERKVLYRQINSQLETIFTRVFLTAEKNTEDKMSAEDPRKNLPINWDENDKADVVLVDYSYRRIATAMAVGAGIGTLITAFMLGSFPGNG